MSVVLVGCNAIRLPSDITPFSSNCPWEPTCHALKKPPVASPMEIELPCAGEELNCSDVVRLALANSPDTYSTWAKARSAAAVYGEALAAYWPNANFVMTYNKQLLTDITGFVPLFFVEFSPQLQLSYMLLDFGRRKWASRTALNSLYAADWTHNQQIQTTVQSAINGYTAALFTVAQRDAAEATLHDAELALDAATVGLMAGIRSRTDQLQGQVSVSQARLTLIDREVDVATAQAKLNNVMGIPQTTRLKLAYLPEAAPEWSPHNVEELIEAALEQRADVRAAQANYESKKAAAMHADRGWLPTFNLNVNEDEAFFFQPRPPSHGKEYQILLTFTWNVFDGWATLNRVREAKANIEEAAAAWRQAELTVEQQVRNALTDVEAAKIRWKASKEWYVAAQESYHATLESYEAGLKIFTDVTTQLSALAQARAAYIHSQHMWYQSLTGLAYATGELQGNGEYGLASFCR
jgi:outer membrane protein